MHLNLTLKARPPINLTGTIGNGYVQLKWGNPNGAYNISVDGYSVYRGLSDKNLDLIATFINDTEYNDTTIQNGLGYYYHVTCFNGAGESDPSDTIYVIDTISPKIIMDMSDSYATTGDIFHFLVIAIDNVLVSNVIVEYWIGEEEHAIDIMQSTDAIRWSSSIIIPDKDSALSYFFNATDLNFNYINSSEYSVIISDNDIPIFGEDTSDNIGSTGDIFKFSINITDNIFVNRSYVRYGINDESINNTENLFIGPDDFYSIITIPDYSISLKYEFIALDKDKNENRTEIKTINIVDDDKPFIVDDLSDELVYTSDVFTFNIIVADNIKVNDVFVKYTMGNIKGNNTLLYDGNSWKYSINTSSEPGSITYSYRIVDSSDNWLISDHMEVPIIDNELPLIFNDQSNNIAYTGDVFYFMADIYDNGIVNDAFVHYWYGNGYQNNISLIRYDINKYQTDIIINGNSLENLYYKFVVIDEYGNVNVTSIFTVVIEDNDMPIIISVTHTNQPINTGDIYNVKVIAEDNIEISKITLYWKQDLNEYHTFDLTEIDGKYGYTIQVKMNSTLPIYYHVQIMDSSNNINSSIVYELFIVDNIPPEISSIPDISINVSSILKLNITVYDNIGIQSIVWDDAPFNFSGYEYCDYVNVSGYFTINISVIDLEGNYAFTTFNLTVLPDKTDNNQNNSQIETIERNYLSIIIIIVSIIFLLCISVIIGWFVIINKRTKNNENEDIIVNELDVEKQIIQEEEKSSSININENE